jgi:hypothetical protein
LARATLTGNAKTSTGVTLLQRYRSTIRPISGATRSDRIAEAREPELPALDDSEREKSLA